MKYFIYTRKSTDSEERQVLSLESQISELKEFAAKEKLEIVASLSEAKTAKKPGRTVFGEMLARIEKGEAQGILASSQAKILLSQSDNQEIRAFLKNIGSNFILKDKKFQFALKIGWRALAESEPNFAFTNWRKGWDSNPWYPCEYT